MSSRQSTLDSAKRNADSKATRIPDKGSETLPFLSEKQGRRSTSDRQCNSNSAQGVMMTDYLSKPLSDDPRRLINLRENGSGRSNKSNPDVNDVHKQGKQSIKQGHQEGKSGRLIVSRSSRGRKDAKAV